MYFTKKDTSMSGHQSFPRREFDEEGSSVAKFFSHGSSKWI